jgi:hypothetical protein
MSDIKLDASGDIDVTDSTFSLVTGRDAIAQNLSIALQWFAGEWFINRRLGIQYFGRILIRGFNDADVTEIFRNELLGVQGVTGIVSLDLDLDAETRQLTVVGKVTSIDGEIDFSEVLV